MQCTLASFLIALIPGEVVLGYKAGLLGYVVPNLTSVSLSEWGYLAFHLSVAGVVRIVDEGEKTRTLVPLILLARPRLE